MNIIDEISRRFAPSAQPSHLDARRGSLPARLLRKGFEENAVLQKSSRRVLPLVESLWDMAPSMARNPELYPPIIGLIRAPAAEVESALNRVELQCGMSTLSDLAFVPEGIHRLEHFGLGVVRCTAGVLSLLDGVAESRSGMTIYLPHAELFADLLDPRLYPPRAAHFDARALVALVEVGLSRVAEYSGDLAADLFRCVSTIALTTDLGHAERWSFNLRLSYLGGIFVNPFRVNHLGMAESILHEYYHQRLWEWWAYDPLDGIPAEDVTVVSPITGRCRPVSVMTHALVIYAGVVHFYDQMKSDSRDLTSDDRAWIEARCLQLRPGIEPLYERLAAAINTSSRAHMFLDFVRDLCRDELITR